MIDDIAHEATFPHPPELVWKALTTPESLGAWLMVTTFQDPTAGHAFRFTDRPRPFWDGVCECVVAEATPHKRLAFTWGTNTRGRPSEVSWTLTPTSSGGTHVAFRHAGLNGLTGWFMKKGMDKGWQRMLTRALPYVLERLRGGEVPTRDEVAMVNKGQPPPTRDDQGST